MQLQQINIPLVAAVLAIPSVVALEYRYNQGELEDQIVELRAEVEKGHDMARLASMIYTATDAWMDLLGREAMYRAQAEAGTLTNPVRYAEVQQLVANKRAELDNLQSQLSGLQ